MTQMHLASAERARIVDQLQREAEAEGKQFAKRLGAFIRSQFARTFAHWNESGRNKFPVPEVKITTQVSAGPRGVNIFMVCLVTGAGGTAHPLWHWLSFGTKDIIAKKTLGPFPLRKDTRTKVRDLDAQPFLGYTGEWRAIGKGKVRKGIPARQWYEAVGEEVKKFVAREGGGLKVTYTMDWQVKKP